jgi:hypothetical protein
MVTSKNLKHPPGILDVLKISYLLLYLHGCRIQDKEITRQLIPATTYSDCMSFFSKLSKLPEHNAE